MKAKTLIINRMSILNDSTLVSEFDNVFQSLKDLQKEYSNFKYWYYKKVFNGIFDGSRTIILKKYYNDIIGLAILKNDEYEKKICTLRVVNRIKDKGLGTEILNQSLNILRTNIPIITVSSIYNHEYISLLRNYEFKLYKIYKSYYRKGIDEYTYNGYLDIKKNNTSINDLDKCNVYDHYAV